MTTPRSRTGRQLATAADAAGWAWTCTTGHGVTERGTLVPADSGRKRRHTQTLACESEAVHLRGPAGTCAVAVFVSVDGQSWRADDSWTWVAPLDHLTEASPRTLLTLITSTAAPERTAA